MRFGYFQNHTSCTRLRAPRDNYAIAELDLRSVKLIRAADMLSTLAALPSPVNRRSPFMICALAMCVMVHSGASLMVEGSGREETMRVRIQLALGALNILGEVWPLARSVKQQVLDIYSEVMMNRRRNILTC